MCTDLKDHIEELKQLKSECVPEDTIKVIYEWVKQQLGMQLIFNIYESHVQVGMCYSGHTSCPCSYYYQPVITLTFFVWHVKHSKVHEHYWNLCDQTYNPSDLCLKQMDLLAISPVKKQQNRWTNWIDYCTRSHSILSVHIYIACEAIISTLTLKQGQQVVWLKRVYQFCIYLDHQLDGL